MRKFSLSLIFVGLAQFLGAQSADLLEYFSAKYPKENGVILKKAEDVQIAFNKSGELGIESRINEERLLLNDNARFYVEDNIHFSHFTQVDNIHAASYIPNGKKYKERKVEEFQTVEEFSDHVFFDDSKLIKLYYPGLVKGARTKMQYTKHITDPRFFGIFYFSSFLPVEESEMKLSFPKNVKVTFKEFHTNGIGLTLTKEEKGKNRIYTWKAENLDKMRSENSAPSISYAEPHIILFIEEYEVDGVKKDVLGTLDDLYAWYYENVKGLNSSPSNELKSIVDSLLSKKDMTELEKVEQVYYWVQDNIRYIAIEEGMQGYVPKDASLVCEERYGDCKGMSSIINTMLGIAGIESYISWVGTNDIPYSYHEVPSPYVDNHMIATYKSGNEYYFLDATSEFLPMGTPSSFIQGKEVLLSKGPGEYEVAEVADVAVDRNGGVDSIFARIEEGKLVARGVSQLRGYNNFEIQQRLMNRSKEEREDYLRSLLSFGNNSFNLTSFELGNLGEREKELRITYAGEVASYVTTYEDNMYFNPHMERDLAGLKIDTANRKYDFERRYRLQLGNHYEIELPESYQASYLPEASSFKSKDGSFGFDISYTRFENKIVLDSEIRVDLRIIKKHEFDEWNSMISKLNQVYNESIVLSKEPR